MSPIQVIYTGAGICGLFLASHASSAVPAKITTEIEVGGEYHFQLFSTDDGLRYEATQVKETDFATRAAKLLVHGKLSEQISWNVVYQLDSNFLERFFITNKISDVLEINVGKQKIKTYGWTRKLLNAWNAVNRPSFVNFNPLKDQLALEASYQMAGNWSVALAKDYFDTSSTCTAASPTTCKSWNAYEVQKQAAIVLEWQGNFGDIQPLVQYARYDRNHSQSISAGVRVKNETLDAYVDYTIDERNDKLTNVVTGKAEDHENKIQGIVVYGEFFTGAWTPYALASTTGYDGNKAADGSEIETNTDGNVNDNERLLGVGVYYEGFTKLYRPYVGLASTAGKYIDPQVKTDEEDRSKLDILVGLTGKF